MIAALQLVDGRANGGLHLGNFRVALSGAITVNDVPQHFVVMVNRRSQSVFSPWYRSF